jgi:hypothetical protein
MLDYARWLSDEPDPDAATETRRGVSAAAGLSLLQREELAGRPERGLLIRCLSNPEMLAARVFVALPSELISYVKCPTSAHAIAQPTLTHCFTWWSQGESNPRPLECHSSALPTELWPRAPVRARKSQLGNTSEIRMTGGRAQFNVIMRLRFQTSA